MGSGEDVLDVGGHRRPVLPAAHPCSDESPDPAARAATGGFDAVYAALWPSVMRFAQLQTGSLAVGEELAQEAFLGLYRHFDRVDTPQAYLRRSVVNASVRVHGRAAKERRLQARAREEISLPPEVDEMWELLTRLPPRQRAVLVLRFYEDRPEAEIADLLGCRPGTVKSLAARGLTRLRRELS